jgi:hypothetical protein
VKRRTLLTTPIALGAGAVLGGLRHTLVARHTLGLRGHCLTDPRYAEVGHDATLEGAARLFLAGQ